MSKAKTGARADWKAAYRHYRLAVREWRRQADIWAYRDRTHWMEPVPKHPAMPTGLVDIDYLLRRTPWHERIALARPRLVRLARRSRSEPPVDPAVVAVMTRLGIAPHSYANTYSIELAQHLHTVSAGCFRPGIGLAELKAEQITHQSLEMEKSA